MKLSKIVILIINLWLLRGCTLSKNKILGAEHVSGEKRITFQQEAVCQQYNWNGVLQLVESYLDETLYTMLVMQGTSSEYRTSEAAVQVIDDVANENIQQILNKIITANCE